MPAVTNQRAVDPKMSEMPSRVRQGIFLRSSTPVRWPPGPSMPAVTNQRAVDPKMSEMPSRRAELRFRLIPPPYPGELSAGADHAVARDDDGDGIVAVGQSRAELRFRLIPPPYPGELSAGADHAVARDDDGDGSARHGLVAAACLISCQGAILSCCGATTPVGGGCARASSLRSARHGLVAAACLISCQGAILSCCGATTPVGGGCSETSATRTVGPWQHRQLQRSSSGNRGSYNIGPGKPGITTHSETSATRTVGPWQHRQLQRSSSGNRGSYNIGPGDPTWPARDDHPSPGYSAAGETIAVEPASSPTRI